MKNKYCSIRDLQNESDVEQKFLIKLIKDLGFKDNQIKTKSNIQELKIGSGRKKENYRPDYLLFLKTKPKVIIDAKNPINDKDITKFEYQLKSYSIEANSKFNKDNPIQYYVISNGHNTSLYKWDEEIPVISLDFEDFEVNNEKFKEFKKLFSEIKNEKEVSSKVSLKRISINDIKKIFIDCHNMMWKKEKISPTKAFYEFSKIIFIKMKEDRKFLEKKNNGEVTTINDLVFSSHWIANNEKTAEKNPFNNILFRQIRDDLEEEIIQKKKKRIFTKNDVLDLRPNTIKSVVEKLEEYDLHSIDEDLNGRMFENFLNATVRGKELGQFFTPRQVVKFMVNASNISVESPSKVSTVFDGCCGSGGFLIEAMAVMIDKVRQKSQLSNKEKDEITDVIKNKSLYGVEANPEIAAVARMNMYLHGDGGSNIFSADCLDTEVQTEEGENQEKVRDVAQLRELFVNEKKKFNIILTNPPFSMKYTVKDDYEKRVLENLKMDSFSDSIKSNILFIIRYYDLLEERGELITIIDDSLLNSSSDRKYLKEIKEKYVIKAVISLPFNTFKNAGTSTKTSILHLRKKISPDEKQPNVFMSICNNIGHDDHGRETLDRNNLKMVLDEYRIFLGNGKSINKIIKNENEFENLTCPLQIFTVNAKDLKDRIDAFYYSPLLKSLEKNVNLSIKKGDRILIDKSKFDLIDTLPGEELKKIKDQKFHYIEVGSVKKNGDIVSLKYEKLSKLPTRARKQVKKGDVIIAKNISSIGNNTIIPDYLDGCFVSTGFIVLRPKDTSDDYKQSYILWSFLRQEYVKKQFYYKSATAVQPEISEELFKNNIDIPVLKNKKLLDEIIKKSRMEVKISGSSILGEVDDLINENIV